MPYRSQCESNPLDDKKVMHVLKANPDIILFFLSLQTSMLWNQTPSGMVVVLEIP
jgi:hypothetical protein